MCYQRPAGGAEELLAEQIQASARRRVWAAVSMLPSLSAPSGALCTCLKVPDIGPCHGPACADRAQEGHMFGGTEPGGEGGSSFGQDWEGRPPGLALTLLCACSQKVGPFLKGPTSPREGHFQKVKSRSEFPVTRPCPPLHLTEGAAPGMILDNGLSGLLAPGRQGGGGCS